MQDGINKTVLITGTSSGIGRTCAITLNRLGWRVFAGVRRERDGQELSEATSSRIQPILLDVTNADEMARAAETIREVTGKAGLDGLVNNAGITVAFPLEFLPIDSLRHQFEVNVFGQLSVIQAMLPSLRMAGGRIVNIGSVSGFVAAPYVGAYAASKHSLQAMNDSLRVELRHSGVGVSMVAPCDVDTPIWTKSREAADQLRDETIADESREAVPQEVRDQYAGDIAAMREATDRSAKNAMPTEHVASAVVHALTARRPKTKYLVGRKTRAAARILRLLPDRIRDWFIRRNFGMK